MEEKKLQAVLDEWQRLLPLSEEDRNRLRRRFTVDFNYNSNHLEGNTLTYGQTEILLLFGKVIGEAELKDVQDMTASNVALKMMEEESGVKDIPLTQNFIRRCSDKLCGSCRSVQDSSEQCDYALWGSF